MIREHVYFIKRYFKLADFKKNFSVLLFLASIFSKLCVLGFTFAGSMLIGYLSDGQYKEAFNVLYWIIALYILYATSRYSNFVIWGRNAKHVYNILSTKVTDKLFDVKESFSRDVGKDRIIGSVNNDIVNISDMSDYLSDAMASIIQIGIALIVVTFQSPTVALVLLLFTVCYILIRNFFDKKVAYYHAKDLVQHDRFSALINQVLNGLKEVRMFNMFSALERQMTKINTKHDYYYVIKRQYINARDNNLLIMVYIFRFLLYVVLILLISQGKIGIAILVLAIAYYENILTYVDILIARSAALRAANNSITRINDILEYDTKNIQFGDTDKDDLIGAIEFKKVSFNDQKKKVLSNINFKINHNEAVAITGEIGAGKTTLFSLLLRLSKPKSGEILIDDTNIFDFNQKSYSKNISIADEKPFIFDMSIRDNFNLVDSNQKHQTQVCKDLGIHNFIMSLPHGYNTVLHENAKIVPAGQLQLISLARTILSKSEVLLLDDVTINLDAEMVRNFPILIKRLKEDHTILMITKNPEIMRSADRVIMLEDGKIIDKGTHTGLMKRCKSYRTLVQNYSSKGENNV
jgi:ATP-binding cassette subfamily B protein